MILLVAAFLSGGLYLVTFGQDFLTEVLVDRMLGPRIRLPFHRSMVTESLGAIPFEEARRARLVEVVQRQHTAHIHRSGSLDVMD